MRPDFPTLPNSERIRAHVLAALGRYWSKDHTSVASLPVAKITAVTISGPLRLVEIKLPDWAAHCGIGASLLIPREAISSNSQSSDDWQQVDWWLAAFLLLEAWHERLWEHEHGPIHSYSFRLPGWDERAWERAWVNRIGLFLRRWATHQSGAAAETQMGLLHKHQIHLTHDVDALAKTLPIRLKQSSFNLLNAARCLRHGQYRHMVGRLLHASSFLFSWDDWWTFTQLQKWEADAGIRATFYFHADRRLKTLKNWLFDPSYDLAAPKQSALLRHLVSEGHRIGLHPSFDTWQDYLQIAAQRAWVEESAGVSITQCRQHWLRFSWQYTWAAQQSAGLKYDSTLMFNDRHGFRNSSALCWAPWHPHGDSSHDIYALPTVFMDSHFYDYQSISPALRNQTIRNYIEECNIVSGEVALLWHPHTLSKDFGWSDGFRDLINLIKEFNR